MKALFKNEWLRIYKLAWILAAINLMLLLVMVNLGLIFSTVIGFKISVIVLYGFVGFLLAVIQIKLYKVPGNWIYFLHRPLSEQQVFLALFAAATLFLIIGLVLPYALITVSLEYFSQQIIDWRHYHQLLYVLGVAITCYLTGCFIMLSSSRWVVVVVIFPILMVMSLNLGGHVFVLQAWAIVLLLPMVFMVFKINLYQTPTDKALMIIVALVIQWCGFMAVSAVVNLAELTAAEISLSSSQKINLEIGVYPEDFRQIAALDSEQKILASLSGLKNQAFKNYQVSMSLGEAFRIRKRVWFHPTEQQIQMMDERALVLQDLDSKQRWTFSHDHMLFVGIDTETLEPIGFMGPQFTSEDLTAFNNKTRFGAIPWINGKQFIAGNQLYKFEPDLKSVVKTFSAQPEELLLNTPQQQGAITTLISNQKLYVFDSIAVQKKGLVLVPMTEIDLPGDYNNLWDISVMEIKDKFLLSFLYGKDPRQHIYTAEQLTYELSTADQIQLIAKRTLKHNTSDFMRHIDYLISPVWAVFNDRIPVLPGRDRYLPERPWLTALPKKIVLFLVVFSLVYFSITYFWSSQRRLSNGQRLFWSMTNALTGLPGMISFLLLYTQVDRQESSILKDDISIDSVQRPGHV